MILIFWIVVSLALMFGGTVVAYPWWFSRLIKERYWCESCHHELTTKARFLASFNAGTDLEGREV